MSYKNFIKNPFCVLISTIFIEISHLIKFSFILGSNFVFFSAINIAAPMVGVLGGSRNGFKSYAIQFFTKWFLLGGLPYLGYHIPHLFASAYWNNDSKVIRLLLPMVCMVAFVANPIGWQACTYAMLWFVPIAIGLLKNNNIFLLALGSTFTAHAVGSVFWIWLMAPMAPEAWVALIPVAITERILFACGMVAVYYCYNYGKAWIVGNKTLFSIKKIFQQS